LALGRPLSGDQLSLGFDATQRERRNLRIPQERVGHVREAVPCKGWIYSGRRAVASVACSRSASGAIFALGDRQSSVSFSATFSAPSVATERRKIQLVDRSGFRGPLQQIRSTKERMQFAPKPASKSVKAFEGR